MAGTNQPRQSQAIYTFVILSIAALKKSLMWPLSAFTGLLWDECAVGKQEIHLNNEIHKNEKNNTCGLSKWMIHSRSFCPDGPHICISAGSHLDNGICIAKDVIQ